MQKQLNHYEFKEKQVNKKNNIIFVLENLEHMENLGSSFRLADAFNIDSIIIVTNRKLDFGKIHKTSRSCEHHIPYQIVNSPIEAIQLVKDKDYIPVNIEITSTSKALSKINFSKMKRVALIVGNENYGISQEMLKLVETSAHIEMYGNNSSLNVSTALAIATYHISENL